MNTRNHRFKSNRVRDIIALFHEELDAIYGSGEVGVFCDMLFEAFLGWDKVRLLTSKEQTIDQSDLLRFHWALEDLKKHRPIQHIIGYTEFCGCRIKVTPDVLIPRPETEEIVNWTLSALSDEPTAYHHFPHSTPRILDLCTGSGCIAIALKKAFPQAEVTAVDVSEKALTIAKENAESNNTAINFLQADLLCPISRFPLSTFHLIISNPPYVRESERAQMVANVLDYDPELALFVPDDDSLCFYRSIAAIAKKHLAQDGLLVVEINEALADETCTLFREQCFAPVPHTDFRGRPRWISAKPTTVNSKP